MGGVDNRKLVPLYCSSNKDVSKITCVEEWKENTLFFKALEKRYK